MDYYNELMRIADGLDKEDALILRSAAIKLAPMVKPTYEKTTIIPGFGYSNYKRYN